MLRSDVERVVVESLIELQSRRIVVPATLKLPEFVNYIGDDHLVIIKADYSYLKWWLSCVICTTFVNHMELHSQSTVTTAGNTRSTLSMKLENARGRNDQHNSHISTRNTNQRFHWFHNSLNRHDIISDKLSSCGISLNQLTC